MHCPHCGKETDDGSKFCAFCGEPLDDDTAETSDTASTETPVEPDAAETPDAPQTPVEPDAAETPDAPQTPEDADVTDVTDATPEADATAQDATQQIPADQTANVPPVPPTGTTATPPTPPVQPVQPSGFVPPVVDPSPLSLAWADIRATFSGMALFKMIIVGILPILNFCNTGLYLRWGTDAARGDRTTMPKGMLANGDFAWGFKAAVITFVWPLIGIFLLVIPVLGWIAFIVWLCLVPCLGILASVRACLRSDMGAGFDFASVWRGAKRRYGQLWVTVFLPGLILAGVGILVSVIFGGALLSTFSSLGSHSLGSSSSSFNPISILGSILAGGLGIFVIEWIIMSAVGVIVNLVTYRAVGYWVARNVPEWPAGGEVPVPVSVSTQTFQPQQPQQPQQPTSPQQGSQQN